MAGYAVARNRPWTGREVRLAMTGPLQSFLPAFLQDAATQLAAMDRALDALSRDLDDPAARDAVIRAAHTIKGNASIMGFGAMIALAAAMESVVLRTPALPAKALALLRQATATLRALVAVVELGVHTGDEDDDLILALSAIAPRPLTPIRPEVHS